MLIEDSDGGPQYFSIDCDNLLAKAEIGPSVGSWEDELTGRKAFSRPVLACLSVILVQQVVPLDGRRLYEPYDSGARIRHQLQAQPQYSFLGEL